jgi:hypothetical protein
LIGVDLIITSRKPYGIIKGRLRKWKKIGIIACNSCARACETGGRDRMEEIAKRLKEDGFEVVQTDLIPMACNVDLVKRPDYEASDLVILACDAAVFTFQTVFPSKKIISANNTIGFGARDGQGNIFLMKRFQD